MILIEADAIVCAIRQHGENGVILRVLTRDHGLLAGYVQGGRSRTLRPILIPGNLVLARVKGRTSDQLPAMSVEPLHSRAMLLDQPLASVGMEWVTALTAAMLPEGHPYPSVFDGLSAVLTAVESSPSARGWADGVIRFERLVLAEAGYGSASSTIAGHTAGWHAVIDDFIRSGNEIAAHLGDGQRARLVDARERLAERLKRAVA